MLENINMEDGLRPETYFSATASSIELDPDRGYEEFFKYPEYTAAVKEHFDITDAQTRKTLLHVNEADQGAILSSLTSKLYDTIVTKANDIDYGDIPETKGDVSKLPNYDKIRESLQTLHDLLVQYKQDTSPVDEISVCLSNIETRKELFMRAFKYNVELPILVYCNAVLSVITGISYMIANSIEFIKTPKQENFEIVIDKMSVIKTQDNMIYSNLKRFNKSCKSKEMDKALEHVITSKIKGNGITSEIAPLAVTAILGGIALVLNILPILREMVFFFYYSRTRVSDFFDIQADLLQMNSYNLQYNEMKDPEEKEKVLKKQLGIVDLFRKIARRLSIVGKESDVKASREISNEGKKFKYDDIMDELPKGAASALF